MTLVAIFLSWNFIAYAYLKQVLGIIFDFKRQKKKKKKKKKKVPKFLFLSNVSHASTNTFMWSDGYQIIQERITSIIIQYINHNPSYNDKMSGVIQGEITCLVLKIRDVIS